MSHNFLTLAPATTLNTWIDSNQVIGLLGGEARDWQIALILVPLSTFVFFHLVWVRVVHRVRGGR